MTRKEGVYLGVLMAASALSFLGNLGGPPLFDVDEGAFSEATREMFERGDFLFTYLNGEPRYDKPILIYWLQAASVAVFGLTEFAVRLPSALASLAWVFLTYRFVRRHLNADAAFLSAFFLATSLQVTLVGKAAIADALLNLFIAASMFALYEYDVSGKRAYLWWSAAAVGLGALTKGPVAILIPVAATFLYSLSRRDLKRWAQGAFDPVALVLFLIITVPWYAYILHDQGRGFIEGFFFKHNVKRFSTPLEGHAGSLVYYIPVIIVGVMPYAALLLKPLGEIKALWRDNLTRFGLVWFGFVLVFFSVSGTKLHHYVIYGYTPLFMLLALQVPRLKREWQLGVPPALLLGALAALGPIVRAVRPHVEDEFARIVMKAAQDDLGPAYWIPAAVAALVMLALGLVPRLPRRARLIGMGLVMVLAVNFHIAPAYFRIVQEPIKEAALLARERGYEVTLYEFRRPSFLFYQRSLAEEGLPRPGDVVVTTADRIDTFHEVETLYRKNGVVLARVVHLVKPRGGRRDER